MPALKALRQFAEDLLSFQKFVLSYQETTVYQMQQVRDAVIGSRSFMEGLLATFNDLKHAENPVERNWLGREVHQQMFTTLTKNGQTAAVFISFETKLAGAALGRTFELFISYLKDNPDVHPILVGQTGAQMFAKSILSERKNSFFPLTEDLQNQVEINTLLKNLLKYEHINVFVPMFKSLVNQPPRMVNLTGEETLTTLNKEADRESTAPPTPFGSSETPTTPTKKRGMLLEPSANAVRAFFEVQIVAALFRQLTQEARLATLGGRITTLEQTYYSLAQQITKLDHDERLAQRKLKDKRQRTRLAGLKLWR